MNGYIPGASGHSFAILNPAASAPAPMPWWMSLPDLGWAIY